MFHLQLRIHECETETERESMDGGSRWHKTCGLGKVLHTPTVGANCSYETLMLRINNTFKV